MSEPSLGQATPKPTPEGLTTTARSKRSVAPCFALLGAAAGRTAVLLEGAGRRPFLARPASAVTRTGAERRPLSAMTAGRPATPKSGPVSG